MKQLINDNVINLTGQSGPSKSYYAKENLSSEEYQVVYTDGVFSKKRFN